MNSTIELTEEQYRAVVEAAQTRGTTLETLVTEWVATLGKPPYYETVDDFARAQRASEATIEESKRLYREPWGGDDADI
jgi:hypothetical protein